MCAGANGAWEFHTSFCYGFFFLFFFYSITTLLTRFSLFRFNHQPTFCCHLSFSLPTRFSVTDKKKSLFFLLLQFHAVELSVLFLPCWSALIHPYRPFRRSLAHPRGCICTFHNRLAGKKIGSHCPSDDQSSDRLLRPLFLCPSHAHVRYHHPSFFFLMPSPGLSKSINTKGVFKFDIGNFVR